MGNDIEIAKHGPIFQYETHHQIYNGCVIFREIKIMDQYDKLYDEVKKKHKTPVSICGYIPSAIANFFASKLKRDAKISEISSILSEFQQKPSFINDFIEKPMKFIHDCREKYVNTHKSEFSNENAEKGYMTDWVANYEISDFLRSVPDLCENIVFLRQVAWDNPEALENVKHEEKERLSEEAEFKGKDTFIEIYKPIRKLMSIEEFTKMKITEKFKNENKPLILVIDLKGHFITGICLEVRVTNEIKEKTVILLDSTKMRYLLPQYDNIFNVIANIAF